MFFRCSPCPGSARDCWRAEPGSNRCTRCPGKLDWNVRSCRCLANADQARRILCRTSVVSCSTSVICSKNSTLPPGESISTCISSISTSIYRNLFVVWFVMMLVFMGRFRAPGLSSFFRSPRSFFELFQRVRHREHVVSDVLV